MSMNTLRRAGITVAALALGGLVALGLSFPSHASGVALPGGALFQERAQEASIPDVAERVSPAVVSIYTSRPVAGPGGGELEEFFGGRGFGQRPQSEQALGSGVIVAADGVVLTNNHVVDNASDIRVVLSDKREFTPKLVRKDKKTDVAVLRIDAKNLPFLPFGDSSKMRIGETVLAVGNPLGVGQTVSKGIISAKGRANVGVADYEDFLQTDAAINPGNSGGALVNLRGELIGLNTAIASRTGGFQGIGFAIPSNMAKQVMDLLLKGGTISRGQMGVLIQDLTPQLAAAFPDAPKEGVLVGDVLDKSPAQKAGLERGDIITKVDGEPVRSASELRNRVAMRGAGQDVRVTIFRKQETKEISVRLRGETAERHDEEKSGEDENARAERGAPLGVAGLHGVDASPQTLRRRDLPRDLRGVMVSSVSGRAVMSGIQEGDVIVEANRRPVETVQDLRKAVNEGPDMVVLLIRRGPGTLFYTLPKDASHRGGDNY
jgi:serine protease Do